jgi:Trk K+ transport system NAD-binding subunit
MIGLPNVTIGNGCDILVQLTTNGSTFVIPGTSTIKASLVSQDHSTVFAGPVVQSLANPQTILATSLVEVIMQATDVAGVTFQGTALMEIKITPSSGIAQTWWVPVNVIHGLI